MSTERLNFIKYRLAELEDEFLHAIAHQDIKRIEDEINQLELEKWYIEKNK